MSEFSDSYHLLTNDPQSGQALLQRAGLEGFVFAPTNGWVTLVADGIVFRPNQELIQANEGILLHLVSAEDYGWYFSVYQGIKLVSHFECYWEEDLYVHDQELDLPLLKELIRTKIKPTTEGWMEELDQLLYPREFDYAHNPATTFTNLLGVQNIDWVAYSCVREDYENATGRYQISHVEASDS